jgi:K+-sensing histidine kinase KdpD
MDTLNRIILPAPKTIMQLIRLKNAKRWKLGGMRPVAICTIGFLAAFALRQLLSPFLNESLSMLFFTVNCIVMCYLYGFVYSMVLLCFSIPTAMFFFRKPFYSVNGINLMDFYLILVYTGIVLLTSFIIEWLQRERYAAVLQQRVSETRYKLLIESDQARRAEYAEQFSVSNTLNADPKSKHYE